MWFYILLIIATFLALLWGFNSAVTEINLLTLMRKLGSFFLAYGVVLIIWFMYALGLLRGWW